MSAETSTWLNQFTLIGQTDKRGKAWHYRASDQGVEDNHYPGAIPVEDVRRRLFGWSLAEGPVETTCLTESGVFTILDGDRKAICRPPGALGPDDKGAILGVFKSGYTAHGYEEWLLDTVATILDDDLSIGSAGLLRDGAQAFVSVEVPENIVTPEGVEFRPNLMACTSCDGSLATTYKRLVTNVVCDNTMSVGLAEVGQVYKVKHSRYSKAKLADAREALAIVHTISEEFAAQVAALTAVKVSGSNWDKFLDVIAPLVDEKSGDAKAGRSLTMAENKRDELRRLWLHDERVAPWAGTAWGVVQAVNTHAHHVQSVRGAERAERNMGLAVTGGFDTLDRATAETVLALV